MTTESSPGQGTSQEEAGWAFRPRPRRPATAAHSYEDRWRPETDPSRDGGPSAEPYGTPLGTRWDTTMPLRFPQPREGAHEAVPEPGPRAVSRPLPATASARPNHPADADAGREQARRPRPVGRIALTLAVLVAVGGGAAALVEQEDATAVAAKQLTPAWQAPAAGADDTLIGSWLTDGLLVRAGSRGGLRAYDLTDGRQVWSATPSAADAERGTVPCAMSPTTGPRGIGTVAFGKDGSTCTWLAGVQASSGKILWSIPLTSARHPTATTVTTYLQGDVATVVGENFLGGVNIRTGSRAWGYKARGHYCNAYGWGTGGTVLVDDFCLDRKTRFTLTAYDGRTGKRIWRRAQSAHSEVTHILSGAPLVAAVHTARQDAVRVLGTTGTGRKLAVGDDELTDGNGTGADHSARLIGDVLVTPASVAGGTAIDGFDITTGARLWTHRSAALAVPASREGDKVYAVTTSGSAQLVTIDPRSGAATPVAGLPAGTGKWDFVSGTVYVTPDGGVLELSALGSNGGVRLYR
ncbi:PQQ-binding-like beta-propeller repeat protein [Streptomyces sp. NPDC001068]|uniref:outer membrane protein assembly factor BamB family protein n=1 Tax=Streptomyces sp. NPDC001068 TaxID=3364544 RepID=UPI0036A36E77